LARLDGPSPIPILRSLCFLPAFAVRSVLNSEDAKTRRREEEEEKAKKTAGFYIFLPRLLPAFPPSLLKSLCRKWNSTKVVWN
jgi:hypothetical protein